jgi:ketosteroid isomerase-like protein
MTKKEFAAGFREWAGRARIESKYEVKDIHASRDVAYLWSYISIVMTSKESDSSTKREGHVLSVFRKSLSGKWLLARDAHLIPTGKQEQA